MGSAYLDRTTLSHIVREVKLIRRPSRRGRDIKRHSANCLLAILTSLLRVWQTIHLKNRLVVSERFVS